MGNAIDNVDKVEGPLRKNICPFVSSAIDKSCNALYKT